MSKDLNIRKITLLRVQKTIKRLYKIKKFYAKFGLTLDVENLDLGQVQSLILKEEDDGDEEDDELKEGEMESEEQKS